MQTPFPKIWLLVSVHVRFWLGFTQCPSCRNPTAPWDTCVSARLSCQYSNLHAQNRVLTHHTLPAHTTGQPGTCAKVRSDWCASDYLLLTFRKCTFLILQMKFLLSSCLCVGYRQGDNRVTVASWDNASIFLIHISLLWLFITWTAWAERRGYKTAKAARNDVYRAANSLLRLALDGRLCLCLRPPGYTQNKG